MVYKPSSCQKRLSFTVNEFFSSILLISFLLLFSSHLLVLNWISRTLRRYGFGFDNAIGEYKVLCLSRKPRYGALNYTKAEIYTLGRSSSWRTIPTRFTFIEPEVAIFGGSVYWVKWWYGTNYVWPQFSFIWSRH